MAKILKLLISAAPVTNYVRVFQVRGVNSIFVGYPTLFFSPSS